MSPLGALLGRSWAFLGPSWGFLEPLLEPSWSHLEALVGHRKWKDENATNIDFLRFWKNFGLRGLLGEPFGHLDSFRSGLWVSWNILETILRHRGMS
eukprot:1557822-Pyramimonas_sp.AAC.1